MSLYNLLHPEEKPISAKYRNELKYICSEADLQIIHSRIAPICPLDRHASNGVYQIRSVYFDDPQNTRFHENENGTDPREKFRIRIYNGSDEKITLECKRKERSMTHKESCSLTKTQCMAILNGEAFPDPSYENPLLNRFLVICAESKMRPTVIAAYDRTPFVYGPGNVRITFDRNIGSTTDISRFFDPYLPLRPILPTGKHILEVKYDEFLPDFLYSVMSLGYLKQTAFSKYYLCRKFTI